MFGKVVFQNPDKTLYLAKNNYLLLTNINQINDSLEYLKILSTKHCKKNQSIKYRINKLIQILERSASALLKQAENELRPYKNNLDKMDSGANYCFNPNTVKRLKKLRSNIPKLKLISANVSRIKQRNNLNSL